MLVTEQEWGGHSGSRGKSVGSEAVSFLKKNIVRTAE
jgi:hypothetical protein